MRSVICSSATSASASSSRRARQRSACSSTASIEPPCLRARRSSSARRSSVASSSPGAASRALAGAAQLGRDVLRLDERSVQRVGELVERRIDAADVVERAGRRGQQRARAGAVLGLERRRAADRRAAQRLDVAQAPATAQQLLMLGRAGLDALDLVDLERQQVELALPRPGPLAQLLERRVQVAQVAPRVGAFGPARRLRGAAEPVEQVELRTGQRQLAMLVLAVERQQPVGQLAQVADRRRAAVDVRARAPVAPPTRRASTDVLATPTSNTPST